MVIKRISFLMIMFFVSCLSYGEQDSVPNDDFYLDYELIHGDSNTLEIYKIMNGRGEKVLSVNNIQQVIITSDRTGVYYLKDRQRNDYYSALWYYNGQTGEDQYLFDIRPNFKVSNNNKYILYYVVTGQYSVDDIRILEIATGEELQYFHSVEIINEKYPGVEYPEYCALHSLDNFDENGVDIAFNRYWEWDDESFTIFISFDDFSYEFTDRMDLFSEYWEDWR